MQLLSKITIIFYTNSLIGDKILCSRDKIDFQIQKLLVVFLKNMDVKEPDE